MTEQQMVEDGWRRCAVGQRTTEHCGMVEEARAQERARLRAMVQPLLDEWLAAYGEPALQAYDAGRVHALRDVLDILDGKDVSHA